MPCRASRSAIERPVRTGGIGMVVDWRMSRFMWLTRSIPEALIRVLPAGVQHGEPGERREVHRSSSLPWTDRAPQVEASPNNADRLLRPRAESSSTVPPRLSKVLSGQGIWLASTLRRRRFPGKDEKGDLGHETRER